MLTQISIENFKGIGEKVTIPIRPITLLFGPNSAQEYHLQAMQYAYEILEHGNVDPDRTTLGGNAVDLGGFRNFVHDRDLNNTISLSFEMDAMVGSLS